MEKEESLKEKVLILEKDIENYRSKNKEVHELDPDYLYNTLIPTCNKYLRRLEEEEKELGEDLLKELRYRLNCYRYRLKSISELMEIMNRNENLNSI